MRGCFLSKLTRILVGPLFAFCVLLGLLALTLAGCGSGAATDESIGYEELLRAIPDAPGTRREVYIDDYAVARRLFDIPQPWDEEAALQEFYDWDYSADETSGDSVPVPEFGQMAFFSPLNQRNRGVAGRIHHLAFDIRSMDQTIVARSPGGQMDVTLGRFDPKGTDEALRSCSECPAPDRGEYRGVSYYSWGRDNETNPNMLLAPPAFDGFGRGGRIAVLDSYVFHTWATNAMKALIGTLRDEMPSLADFEEYRLLAGGMSQLGAYSMFLSDITYGLEAMVEGYLRRPDATREDAAKRRAAWGGPGTLRPYQAFATGAGKDEDGPYLALVLVHADSGPAEQNVDLLRRRIEEGSSRRYETPWSDQIDIASLEIRSEGRLLLAKLRGPISRGFGEFVVHQDNLIVHD